MIEQGTDEWHQQRIGKVTASRIADVMAVLKSGQPGAGRKNYMAELVAERLTGTPASSFSNAAMQWGIEQEENARAAYAFIADVDVQEVGFIDHPDIPMTGASPDGLVGDEGLVEIKCPNTATHIETLRGAGIPDKYRNQMLWQMACTGRKWCDFVSFDPRLPAEMQVHIVRVDRDDDAIADIEEAVGQSFLPELHETVADLQARYKSEEAA